MRSLSDFLHASLVASPDSPRLGVRRTAQRRCWSRVALAMVVALVVGLSLGSAVIAQEQKPEPEQPQLALDAGGHTIGACKLAFIMDGTVLMSCGNDKTVRLWNVQTGELIRTIRAPQRIGDTGRLYGVALHPDGNRIAFGGFTEAYTTYTYLLDKGQLEWLMTGHKDVVMDLAFSPKGKWLATCSADKTIKMWETGNNFKSKYTLEGHTDTVYNIDFSPSGLQLASVSYDGTLKIWSTQNGRLVRSIPASSQKLFSVSWSDDGKKIATGGEDMAVRIWSPEGRLLQTVENLGNQIFTLKFFPDGNQLLGGIGGYSGDMFGAGILDLTTSEVRVSYEGVGDTVCCCAVTPDGNICATGDHAGQIEVWNASDGSLIHLLQSKGHTHYQSAWRKDSKAVGWGNVYADRGKPPKFMLDLEVLELVETPKELLNVDSWVSGSTTMGKIKVTEPEMGKLNIERDGKVANVITLTRPHDRAKSACVLPNERAIVGTEYSQYLYNLKNAERLLEYTGHTGIVYDIAPSPDFKYFITASEDQTLRIWDLHQELPLLSIFAAEDSNDWVIWTPEGYYACSPGGERLMGWHVNNWPNGTPSYYPAAQFRKSLYRPDIIKMVLQTGNTASAIELANRGMAQPTQQVEVADVLPPVVTITLPDGNKVTATEPTIIIQAVAQTVSKEPVKAMQLLMNDRPYQETEGRRQVDPAKGKQIRESWQIDLVPGVHRIVVKAETDSSYGLSDPIEITYKPELTELPTMYILAVGISKYGNRDFELDYAADDARAVAAAFTAKSKTLFKDIKTRIVTDNDASRNGVLDGLTWLKQQMTHRDVGVFFYAGHGVKDTNGMFYLFPSDGENENLDRSAIAADQIKRYCQTIPGRLLMLLDACHTGALGGDRRRALGGLTDDLVRDLVTDDYGVIMFASSMGQEYSIEDAEWKHGAFTKAIVEGLEGYADYNRDKTVYLNELELYVPERVKELTSGKQHPVSQKPTTIRSFPLAIP